MYKWKSALFCGLCAITLKKYNKVKIFVANFTIRVYYSLSFREEALRWESVAMQHKGDALCLRYALFLYQKAFSMFFEPTAGSRVQKNIRKPKGHEHKSGWGEAEDAICEWTLAIAGVPEERSNRLF